jgi:DNA-directed RNA polymerase subunit N (RpoN/RPB10)
VGKKVNYATQLKPAPLDAIAQRITADKESEAVLAAAIAEMDSDHIIGRSDDSKLVTDFVFLCVRQMAYCHVLPTDFETRGKKTALMRLGFTGFCCRHCNDINNPETSLMVVDYSLPIVHICCRQPVVRHYKLLLRPPPKMLLSPS